MQSRDCVSTVSMYVWSRFRGAAHGAAAAVSVSSVSVSLPDAHWGTPWDPVLPAGMGPKVHERTWPWHARRVVCEVVVCLYHVLRL